MPDLSARASALAPHPVLTRHYDSAPEREGFVRALFDASAREYDRVNGILSLGSGRWYRRYALRRAGLRPGMKVLDVATGTGLLAREARAVVGDAGQVVGLDASAGMLRASPAGLGTARIQARAEALPLAAAGVDFVTMGYALRHVPDLRAAFNEFRRVLRPGGTLLLLEIAAPSGRLGRRAARLYVARLAPALCRLAGLRSAGPLLRYYWDTIDGCVPASTIIQALGGAGFAHVECDAALGLFRAYRGRAAS